MSNAIAIATILSLFVGTGAEFLVSSTVAAPQKTSQAETAIKPIIENAVRKYYQKQGATRLETFKVTRVAVVSPYALASWNWGDGGGQAALVKKNGIWSVLTSGGGQINKVTLAEKGVPAEFAKALVKTNR